MITYEGVLPVYCTALPEAVDGFNVIIANDAPSSENYIGFKWRLQVRSREERSAGHPACCDCRTSPLIIVSADFGRLRSLLHSVDQHVHELMMCGSAPLG